MNWNSWADFVSMGGYGFYVWGSYLVTVALIVAEVAGLRLRRRRAKEAARRAELLRQE